MNQIPPELHSICLYRWWSTWPVLVSAVDTAHMQLLPHNVLLVAEHAEQPVLWKTFLNIGNIWDLTLSAPRRWCSNKCFLEGLTDPSWGFQFCYCWRWPPSSPHPPLLCVVITHLCVWDHWLGLRPSTATWRTSSTTAGSWRRGSPTLCGRPASKTFPCAPEWRFSTASVTTGWTLTTSSTSSRCVTDRHPPWSSGSGKPALGCAGRSGVFPFPYPGSPLTWEQLRLLSVVSSARIAVTLVTECYSPRPEIWLGIIKIYDTSQSLDPIPITRFVH